MQPRVSVGLVVYRTPVKALQRLFDLLAATPQIVLVLVFDNGSDADLQTAVEKRGWRYLTAGCNLGFGAGHNRLFHASADAECDFHLLLNPDIEWIDNPLAELTIYLLQNPRIAAVMPDVIGEDGERQYLAKREPTPALLFGRRFLPRAWMREAIFRYELRDFDFAAPCTVPVISGCFMLLRRNAFVAVGGFDERYFLYLEDYDLCRRLRTAGGELAIVPDAQVIHGHQRSSYRWGKPLAWHIRSAVRYFWGW